MRDVVVESDDLWCFRFQRRMGMADGGKTGRGLITAIEVGQSHSLFERQ